MLSGAVFARLALNLGRDLFAEFFSSSHEKAVLRPTRQRSASVLGSGLKDSLVLRQDSNPDALVLNSVFLGSASHGPHCRTFCPIESTRGLTAAYFCPTIITHGRHFRPLDDKVRTMMNANPSNPWTRPSDWKAVANVRQRFLQRFSREVPCWARLTATGPLVETVITAVEPGLRWAKVSDGAGGTVLVYSLADLLIPQLPPRPRRIFV